MESAEWKGFLPPAWLQALFNEYEALPDMAEQTVRCVELARTFARTYGLADEGMIRHAADAAWARCSDSEKWRLRLPFWDHPAFRAAELEAQRAEAKA
jgi:hypothetical protein